MGRVRDGIRTLRRIDPETGYETGEGVDLRTEDVSEEHAQVFLSADPESENGRSQWLWVRLPNGDLLLATYPQGDTYLQTEYYCTI